METSRVADGTIIILSVLGAATREHHGTNRNQVRDIHAENACISLNANTLMGNSVKYVRSTSNVAGTSTASRTIRMLARASQILDDDIRPTSHAAIHAVNVRTQSIA